MLESIIIKKLFGLFDYDIKLDNAENITILTGPNGYGKTTILNIIYHFFNQQFYYFQKLSFEQIIFEFSQGERMEVIKINESEKVKNQLFDLSDKPKYIIHNVEVINVHIVLFQNNKKVSKYIYNSKSLRQMSNALRISFPLSIRQLSEDLWLNIKTNEQLTFDEILNENKGQLPEDFLLFMRKQQGIEKENPVIKYLNKLDVYLIKEQRLFCKIFGEREEKDSFVNTIEFYAKDLKKLIAKTQGEAYEITQKLDSSFPKRLIEETTIIDKNSFEERFAKLKIKQNKLQQFGIATTEQEIPDYNTKSAKVLSVYLSDSEEKLKVYDDLLTKIELFVNIINQKDFAFKSIQISSNKGFSFYQNKQKQELNLTDLSSGEQQEVVLLYELLFKTTPNTLILIDEPEISLHMLWQKAFIDDLQAIAKVQNIKFLVATHSPQIINNHWDLTRDLYDLSKTDENE